MIWILLDYSGLFQEGLAVRKSSLCGHDHRTGTPSLPTFLSAKQRGLGKAAAVGDSGVAVSIVE